MDFVPSLSVLLPFALACVILTITPGPDMTLFIGRALSEGRAAGLAAMAGATSGIFIHTSMVALGLSALIVAAPTAFFALKIAGALYLVFLAVQAVRHGSAFRPKIADGAARPLHRHFLAGLGVNLLNPKIILFFMTFLPQFVSAADPHAVGKLLFLGAMFVAIALPITIPMILAADGFSQLMRRHPAIMRVLDWTFAGVFSAFAIRILFARSN